MVSSTVNAGQLVNMTSTNAALLQRLERMEQVVSQPRELNSLANQEIEEIGEETGAEIEDLKEKFKARKARDENF